VLPGRLVWDCGDLCLMGQRQHVKWFPQSCPVSDPLWDHHSPFMRQHGRSQKVPGEVGEGKARFGRLFDFERWYLFHIRNAETLVEVTSFSFSARMTLNQFFLNSGCTLPAAAS
jgi:hypothetical protein